MSGTLEKTKPITAHPEFNYTYLLACKTPSDPTMVWGIRVAADPIRDFVKSHSRQTGVIISPTHVLLKAIGYALNRHPALNARILLGRVRRYRTVNVLLSMRHRDQNRTEVLTVLGVDRKSLKDIADELWRILLPKEPRRCAESAVYLPLPKLPIPFDRFAHAALMKLILWTVNCFDLPFLRRYAELTCASTIVNVLSNPTLPQMVAYKPSRIPAESCTLHVTMGRADRVPIEAKDGVKWREVFPLFIRADHRVCDAFELGEFLVTLQEALENPSLITEPESAQPAGTSPLHL